MSTAIANGDSHRQNGKLEDFDHGVQVIDENKEFTFVAFVFF